MGTNFDLIAKKLSGETSVEEEAAFNAWLNSDKANQQAFDNMEKLWKLSGKIHNDYSPDTGKAWELLAAKMESSGSQTKVLPLSYYLKRAAAALVVIAGVGLLMKLMFKEEDKTVPVVQKAPVPLNHIRSADSILVFYLPDSTRISLNKRSVLSYPEFFSDTGRYVVLNGEAFFEVKHNAQQFIITCNGTRTQVLGTSFNVKGYEGQEDVEVNVVTGNVEFSSESNRSQKISLRANENARFNKKQASIKRSVRKGNEQEWWNAGMKNGKIKRKIKQLYHKLKRKIK
jgi:ferric-dicitrate binding protein FerR (iron transport regulator)